MAALALGAAFAGLMGWYAFGGPAGPSTPAQPDIPEPEPEQLTGTRGVIIQVMDKHNPRRSTAELRFAGMDPIEGERHMVAVDKPEAWIALKNGWWLRVEANAGTLYMPDQQRGPESGTLRGGVVIHGYKPTTNRERPSSGEAPSITAKSPTLSFDTILNQISTPDRFTIQAEQWNFAGTDVLARFNQAKQRVDVLEIKRDVLASLIPESDEQRAARRNAAANDATTKPTATASMAGAKPVMPAPGAANASKTTAASDPSASQSQVASANVAGGNTANARSQPDATQPETLYQLTMADDVRIEQAGRELTGQALTAWARLIDGKLPEGALAPLQATSATRTDDAKRHATAPAPSSSASSASPISLASVIGPGPSSPSLLGARQPEHGITASPDGAMKPASSTSSQPVTHKPVSQPPASDFEEDPSVLAQREPITLRSSGTMVLRALDAEPAQLEQDHLAFRIASKPEHPTRSRFIDAIDGVFSEADAFEYAGTTKRFVMEGSVAEPARVDITGRATIEAPRVEADLTAGLVGLPGAGRMTASDGPSVDRCLQWSTRADFVLLTHDGTVEPALTQAIVQGNVRAGDGATAMLWGDYLRAEFTPSPTQADQTLLHEVIIEGASGIESVRSGTLQADRLHAFFDGVDGSNPIPSHVSARGDVRATGGGGEFEALSLEASLKRSENGKDVEVAEAVLRGLATYENEDGIRAEADEIVAWPVKEMAVLTSDENSTLAMVQAQGTRIRATEIQLDGRARRIEVPRAGEFTHQETLRESGADEVLQATWEDSLTFDELSGVLTCVGNIDATSTTGLLAHDAVQAAELRVEFAPPGAEQISDDTSLAGSREIRRIVLSSLDGAANNAKITSKRYRLEPAATGEGDAALAQHKPRLEQLTYLEGPIVDVDQLSGVGWVRGAGKMLLVDERPTQAESSGTTQPLGSGDGLRGTTQFAWSGSATAERANGRIELARDVRLTHRPQADDRIVVLECQRLVSFVDLEDTGGTGGPKRGSLESGRLRSATASGGSYLRYGTRELTAPNLEYDAVTGIVRASAGPGAPSLTFFDQATATTINPRRIEWNLKTDSWQVDEHGSIVVPR